MLHALHGQALESLLHLRGIGAIKLNNHQSAYKWPSNGQLSATLILARHVHHGRLVQGHNLHSWADFYLDYIVLFIKILKKNRRS